MTFKKKTLLVLLGATVLVGAAGAASAEDWSWFWGSQPSYVANDDGYASGYRTYDGDHTRTYNDGDRYRTYNDGDRTYSDGDAYRGSQYGYRDYRNAYSGYGNDGRYYGYRDRADLRDRYGRNGYGSYDRGEYRHSEQHFGGDDDDD